MFIDFNKAKQVGKNKPARFLKAVIDCIEFIGHDFYTTKGGISLKEVTKLADINIDIRKLLFSSGGGGETIMRYALASLYNTHNAEVLIMQQHLKLKNNSTTQTMFDISSDDDISQLCDHVGEYRSFGAMCFNLDVQNQDIIKRLLDNYCGW